MDILTKNVPRLDPERVGDSFQKIQDYLCDMMEQIDYTLSRQGVVLGKTNLEGTLQQMDRIQGQISAVSSSLSALNGLVSVLSTRAAQAEEQAGTLSGRMDGLDARFILAEGELLHVKARVDALEQKEGGA